MVSEAEIRSICLALPSVRSESPLSVESNGKQRALAWVWLKRIAPKKARVPCPEVYAVRTASLEDKEALITAEPDKYFTEPHYNGYPAVLVRLSEVEREDMEELLIESWLAQAPTELSKRYTPSELLGLVSGKDNIRSEET